MVGRNMQYARMDSNNFVSPVNVTNNNDDSSVSSRRRKPKKTSKTNTPKSKNKVPRSPIILRRITASLENEKLSPTNNKNNNKQIFACEKRKLFLNNANQPASFRVPHQKSMRTNTSVNQVQKELSTFYKQLNSPAFLSTLNSQLKNSLSGRDMFDYYCKQPDMKYYTLETELHRMNYVLYDKTGETITDKVDLSLRALKDSVCECCSRPEDTDEESSRSSTSSTGKSSSAEDIEEDMIWRCANQSLFADAICSLTTNTGLIRPQFSTAASADRCGFVIYLHRNGERDSKPSYVMAQCHLNISIPSGSIMDLDDVSQGSGASDDSERFHLATVLLDMFFLPSKRKIETRLSRLRPNTDLSEEDLRIAARSLVI